MAAGRSKLAFGKKAEVTGELRIQPRRIVQIEHVRPFALTQAVMREVLL